MKVAFTARHTITREADYVTNVTKEQVCSKLGLKEAELDGWQDKIDIYMNMVDICDLEKNAQKIGEPTDTIDKTEVLKVERVPDDIK